MFIDPAVLSHNEQILKAQQEIIDGLAGRLQELWPYSLKAVVSSCGYRQLWELALILQFILSSTLGIAAKCLWESLIGCSNLPYHPFFVLSFPLKPKLLLLRIKYLSTFRWNCRPFWSHSTDSLILTQGFEGETRHFVTNEKKLS
jgi:hypothetical protein